MLDLLTGDGGAFEVNFCVRGVSMQLGFDIASSVNAARIKITKMVDVCGLALGLDRLGGAVQEANG